MFNRIKFQDYGKEKETIYELSPRKKKSASKYL